MSTASLEILETGLDAALLLIDGLANAPKQELAEGIGRLVQEQTRHRIEDEKTTPEGAAWKPNLTNTSILYQSGALSRSIDYIASPESVQVGSGLVYARIHQNGGVIKPVNGNALKFWWQSGGFVQFAVVKQVNMPARKYLGISAANQRDIVDAAEDWMRRLVQ